MPLSIRQRFRVALVVGVASVGLGGWLLASRYHDFDYQLQGKCDYRPCVTSADLPTVVLLVGLLPDRHRSHRFDSATVTPGAVANPPRKGEEKRHSARGGRKGPSRKGKGKKWLSRKGEGIRATRAFGGATRTAPPGRSDRGCARLILAAVASNLVIDNFGGQNNGV